MAKKVIIAALFIAALAFGIFEARETSQLREQVQTLEQERAQLVAQVNELQGEVKKASVRQPTSPNTDVERSTQNLAELLRLRSEVTRLQNDSADLAQKNAKSKEDAAQREPTASQWIDRANKVQQFLTTNAAESIPEIQFANMSAWLNSIQFQVQSDNDLRRAAFLLRNQAQMKFTGFIGDAVRQYEQANNGQFPNDLSQLLEYMDPATGRTMMDLYQVAPRSSVTDPTYDGQGDWIITRKEPVNPGSPHRIAVFKNGRRTWFDIQPLSLSGLPLSTQSREGAKTRTDW